MTNSTVRLGSLLVAGTLGLAGLASASVASAQPYYGGYGYGGYGGYSGYGQSEYRCTRGSDDHCAWFRCDADGDNCHRVSRWTAHARVPWRGDQWRYDRGSRRCDWDGDNCRGGYGWRGYDDDDWNR